MRYPNPDGVWMAQQARNLAMYFEEQGEYQSTHIIRDRDTKFIEQFCSILESEDIEFCPITPRCPNMNPFAEIWIQRIKRECLDHFLVLGEDHLRYLIREFLTHYHDERPHQGIGNRPPKQVKRRPKLKMFDRRTYPARNAWAGS